MRRISTAKLRKWVLVGLGVGTLVSLLSGILLTCDWGGLLLNVGAELAGALATYGLLELFIKRREEEKTKKADLIAQMGSRVPGEAIRATEELRRHDWLYDGSLQGANLGGAKLQGTILSRANLKGAFLRGANLQATFLIEAILWDADLTWADLQGAYLQGARLLSTKLQNADLTGADLKGAILAGTNLEGAILVEANLQGAEFNKHTTLPDGTKWTPAPTWPASQTPSILLSGVLTVARCAIRLVRFNGVESLSQLW